MKKVEITRKGKIGIGAGIALVIIAAVIIGIALAVPSCSDSAWHGSAALEEPSEADKSVHLDAAGTSESAGNTEADEASRSTRTQAGGENTNGDGSRNGDSAGSTSSGSSVAGSSSGTQSSKRWVTDYKQVWVEDSAAWDEQVPIYSQREISVCNICGATITGSETAHAKQHMLAGEGSGHHSEVITEITSYDTVHHDANGHWETIEDGGHWE